MKPDKLLCYMFFVSIFGLDLARTTIDFECSVNDECANLHDWLSSCARRQQSQERENRYHTTMSSVTKMR